MGRGRGRGGRGGGGRGRGGGRGGGGGGRINLFAIRTRNLSCRTPAILSAFSQSSHHCGQSFNLSLLLLSTINLFAISLAYMIIRDTFLAASTTGTLPHSSELCSGKILWPRNFSLSLSKFYQGSNPIVSTLPCRRSLV